MKKQNKQSSAPFANLSMWSKFVVTVLLLIIAVGLISIAMVRTIANSQREKYLRVEQTAVLSAEQIMNMCVETAISIEKNIYTNEAIYDFLDTRYQSAADYYATYYPLQQNTALNLADTNIVRHCTIYTSNSTVLSGGNIQKIDAARSQLWYQTFRELEQPTILVLDPDTMTMTLVRKLDYQTLSTGESYVCLDMNLNVLMQFEDNLDFDGELYVVSDNCLIYSNIEGISSVDQLTITPEYQCISRNYYTTNLEFYAHAYHSTYSDLVYENRLLLIALTVVMLLIIAVSLTMFLGIRMRLRPVIAAYEEKQDFPSLTAGANGTDEIGQLLDICSTMSEHIERTGDESKAHTDSLLRKSSEYNTLFQTAMRLDAELTMDERLPELRLKKQSEMIPLAEEAGLVEKLAKKLGISCDIAELAADQWEVPAYSLVLIADDVFRRYINPSVTFTVLEETALVTFASHAPPKPVDMLRLRAIFEDSNVSEVYDFNRNYRFNPYMRLKASLGGNADIELSSRNEFKLVLKIRQQGGTP